MKNIVLTYFIFFPLSFFAQKVSITNNDTATVKQFITPYYYHENFKTWGVVVKALASPLIQGWILISSLGVEYGFGVNSSIGLHGYFNAYNDLHDGQGSDPPTGEQGYYRTDKGVLLNARQFFYDEKFHSPFYIGAIGELGNQFCHWDKYYSADTIRLSQNKNYIAFGVMTGLLIKFNNQRWGLDMNVSGVYNMRSVTTNYFANTPSTSNDFKTFNLQGSIAFYFWLFADSKKKANVRTDK